MGSSDCGNAYLHPTVRAALHDAVPRGKVLEPLGRGLSAVEGLGDLASIGTRKLEKYVSADGKDGRARLCGILFEILVRRHERDLHLARFRKHRLDVAAAAEGNQVLEFVGVDGEERPFFAREERVLDGRQDETPQGEGVRSQASLVEIHDHPVAFVHRFPDEKVDCVWPKMWRKRGSAVKADVLLRIGSRITARMASLTWS